MAKKEKEREREKVDLDCNEGDSSFVYRPLKK